VVFRTKAQADSYICVAVHMTDSKAILGVTFAGVESYSLARSKWPKMCVRVAYIGMRGVLSGRVLGKV